jgi:hypothetical protein
MLENCQENRSENKQANTVRVPLIEPIRAMIHRDVGDKAEAVIDTVEGIVSTSTSENVYDELVEALVPIIDQRAKMLAGKILVYKRKPCREGSSCRNRSCIFLHEGERRGKSYRTDEENDSRDGMYKRVKMDDPANNPEVIFNKVNEGRHDAESLKEYAARFGNVVGFRRLNAEKYLVVFDSADSANKLVRSSDFVLGDPAIKKFFNVMENLIRVELRKLFEEQDNLMGRMFTNYSVALLNQLKAVNQRIRTLVTRDRTRNPAGGNVQREEPKKEEFDQEQSLFFNCF